MRWVGYVVCRDGKIAQVRKLHRRDNAGQRKLGMNYFEIAKRNLESFNLHVNRSERRVEFAGKTCQPSEEENGL